MTAFIRPPPLRPSSDPILSHMKRSTSSYPIRSILVLWLPSVPKSHPWGLLEYYLDLISHYTLEVLQDCVMHASPRCAGDAGRFRSDSRAYFVMIISVRCNRVRNVLRGETWCWVTGPTVEVRLSGWMKDRLWHSVNKFQKPFNF